ncbi:hypothetical protein, partial [Pseudooceanicola sp.]|uniref:hypothetical protein n=1 Tax=Pseudooceanicola sp. TaxID=1914328 RepID=UPI00351505BF
MLGLTLHRLAAELRALQAEARAVDAAIGQALLDGAPAPGAALASLQRIDLIVQSLGALGAYLAALPAQLPADPQIDINAPLGRIPLRDKRRRRHRLERAGDRLDALAHLRR